VIDSRRNARRRKRDWDLRSCATGLRHPKADITAPFEDGRELRLRRRSASTERDDADECRTALPPAPRLRRAL